MIVFIALCQTFGLIVNAALPLSLGFVRFDGGGALFCGQQRSPPLEITPLWVLTTAETPASIAAPGWTVDPPTLR